MNLVRDGHGLPAVEVVLGLGTDTDAGLTAAEARQRLERHGPNALPPARRPAAVVRLLRQLHHPLVYVLLAAALVTGLLGEYVDCGVIVGVVVLNAVVGFVQESQAEGALDGLRALVRTRARVVRDGHAQVVASEDVVPGDLVVLEAGDKVPADLRLVRSSRLSVDESALTGESVPVDKDEAVVVPAGTPVADRRNLAYSGTLVTAGSGAGVAVATGAATELGAIHRLVGAAESLATPLAAKLASFSRLLTVAILALAAVTFAVGLIRGQGGAETFTAAIALAVGAIPEGLPAAVTITLAIGGRGWRAGGR
nr:HAD-IC family P-type ATPase [Jiangella ureilytica]